MENGVTPDMIKRFLNNQSDEAEAERIAEYLKSNPQILERYSNDEDAWQEGIDKHLPLVLREKLWHNVEKKINVSKCRMYKWLAAASMTGIVFGAYFFFSQNKKEPGISNAQYAILTRHKNVIENNTYTEKEAALPDGSRIVMKSHTSVYYYDTFSAHRDIYMNGQAYFEVAHDKKHPFTVYANGISTTALGTHFWVISNDRQSVTVKLSEGKVVVRSIEKSFTMKDVFLSPGEKVVISKKTGLAIVSRFKENEGKKDIPVAGSKKVESKTIWTNSAYTFSKASLAKVFDRIALQYHVQIKLADSSIGDYQFTGKIMYDDSLGTIMTAICEMNNLKFNQSGSIINIEKK